MMKIVWHDKDYPLKEYQGQLTPFKYDENQADNQGECPHCQEKSKDGFYCPVKDKDCFIGFMKPNLHTGRNNQYIAFFKCRKCGEEFWCHNPQIRRIE